MPRLTAGLNMPAAFLCWNTHIHTLQALSSSKHLCQNEWVEQPLHLGLLASSSVRQINFCLSLSLRYSVVAAAHRLWNIPSPRVSGMHCQRLGYGVTLSSWSPIRLTSGWWQNWGPAVCNTRLLFHLGKNSWDRVFALCLFCFSKVQWPQCVTVCSLCYCPFLEQGSCFG